MIAGCKYLAVNSSKLSSWWGSLASWSFHRLVVVAKLDTAVLGFRARGVRRGVAVGRAVSLARAARRKMLVEDMSGFKKGEAIGGRGRAVREGSFRTQEEVQRFESGSFD